MIKQKWQFLIIKQVLKFNIKTLTFKKQLQMRHKQNISREKRQSSIFMTHQAKPKQRYPLKDLQTGMNSIEVSPAHHWIKPSLNFSQNFQNQSSFFDKPDLSLSLKQKYKLMHISSVHELIATAREKKSQIQDLLRKQQNKAQLEQLQQGQVSASLRKLKKVVRLMEIVCKIILGKNEQNSYLDLSTQQQVSMREIHNQSIENYEHQLNTKNCQIQRLKKLVQLLSAPKQNSIQESLSRDGSHSNYNYVSNNNNRNIHNESVMIVRSSIVEQDFNINLNTNTNICTRSNLNTKRMCDTQVQTQSIQLSNLSLRLNQIQQQTRTRMLPRNFMINQQYSLWNILDAKNTNLEEQQQQSSILQTKQNKQIAGDQQFKQIQSQVKQINLTQFANNLTLHLDSVYKSPIVQQFILPTSIPRDNINNINLNSKKIPCLSINNQLSMQMYFKGTFLKRYKKMVKIAIGSLNLCNNIFMKCKQSQQVQKIQQRMTQLTEEFNEVYGKSQVYNDDVCKQFNDKIKLLYDDIYKIYKVYINHKDSFFFLR